MSNNSSISIFRKQLNIGAFSHAYLLWGSDEAGKENVLQECAGLLLGEEYHFFELTSDTESGTISINAARAMRARVFQTPFGDEHNGGRKARQVFVIRAIERISRDALPLLLKILEEPPSGVLFLATTNNLERLSKPLRSRFSLVRAARSLEDNPAFVRFQKLPLKQRWDGVSKLVEAGDFELMLRSAILEKERMTKEAVSSQQKNAQRKIHELEQLWQAYQLYQFDPTASKRLIGEYAAAFI